MDLIPAVGVFLFVAIAFAEIKQETFVIHKDLESKNITTGVISKSERNTETGCARTCVAYDTCKSFFYNNVTGECQCHDVAFTTPAGAIDQEGLQYYYIIEENNWCPEETGFELLSKNGPCVKFHTDIKSWYKANETCMSYCLNCRLVVLDNKEKNDLVKAAGLALQITHGVWIGIREYALDAYRWVNEKDLNFTDWGPTDQSKTTREDCVRLGPRFAWTWGKITCTNRYHYICEVDDDNKQYRK